MSRREARTAATVLLAAFFSCVLACQTSSSQHRSPTTGHDVEKNEDGEAPGASEQPAHLRAESGVDETSSDVGVRFGDRVPEGPEYAEFEDAYLELVAQELLPSNTASHGGMAFLRERMIDKMANQQKLVGLAFSAIEQHDHNAHGWSYLVFRSAQSYIDLACQVRQIEPPPTTNSEATAAFRDAGFVVVKHAFGKARPLLRQVVKADAEPWSVEASAVLEDIPAGASSLDAKGAREVCESHRELWPSPEELERAELQVPDNDPQKIGAERARKWLGTGYGRVKGTEE